MDYIEDWVDRALSCFYRERDKDSPEPNNNESLNPAAEFSDEGKLRDAFEKFVAELGLNEEKRLELIAYPDEKKLTLLVSKNGQAEENVDHLLDALRQPSPELPALQNLVISLRTQTESFLASFLEASGLSLLREALINCCNRVGTESRAFLLLCAFRALLNSEGGRQAVFGNSEALEAIARSIGTEDAKCKVAAVEVLSGLCFVTEEGHHQVLTAITQASENLCERTRFQRLVDDFHKRFSTDRETDRVRTAILGLFNALLRNGPAENSAHFRAHLRFELLMLGIDKALEQAKESASSRLEDHIDLFEMMRKEDELTISGTSEDSGASSPVDFESVVGMVEALHEKLSSSLALPHFISLLQHLFMVPCDERHVPLWRLFDLILQQLTLQTTVDGIADVRKPITGIVDMEDVLARIQTQCDYENAERELERLREELEHERMRCIELENRLADANDGRTSVSSGVSSLSSTPSDQCPPTPPPGPALPPICPPVAPPPPPPPMGMKGIGFQEVQKKVPKPPQSLKTLNWVKFNSEKTKGSVWEFIEDEKMYKQLDLEEIDHTFAASSSHKDDDCESVIGTLQRRRETQVSVIDPRRFQNCTIMLSKLKLTHKEIKSALYSMDEKGKLPKDMIEQMLKFVPTREEMIAINEAVNRHKSPQILALADRYLYEVSQIPRFEQRLRCLHIIRTFKDRVEALQPHISAVLKASAAMSSCKRLKQYLALILATGNYLNHGKRNGNAYGFDLSSLTKLIDVKQSNRADRNLLHFLLMWIDRKQPDMTKLKRDLSSVYEAARFNRGEVHSEMRSLEQAITIVRTELHFVNSQKTSESVEEPKEESKKDRFGSVAKQFISSATSDYNALEKQYSEMKNKFTECSRLFCFDTQASPEELFSLMSKFLNQLEECQHQQYIEIEEIEKVKRQTIARSYFAKKSRRRDKEKDFEQLISALQSGDIFSEDLKRLRTSFRVTKKTRSAKA